MITLDEAKRHLRIDGTDEDADVALKLKLALAIVSDYTGAGSSNSTNYMSNDDIVDAATMLVLGELYANREAQSDPLSPSVRMILQRLRIPTFA